MIVAMFFAFWFGSAIALGVLWGLWRTVGLRIAARILDAGRLP